MKVIFLDFDGVLFDTVKEAYLLSRCAYDGISPHEQIEEKEYAIFHKYRYLITKSRHFYYIFQLIKMQTPDSMFEQQYKFLIEKSDNKLVDDFDKKYVKARESLISENFEFWDSLDEPYPFFYKLKELIKNKKNKYIILTNKKYLPVSEKLKKYGLEIDLYANENMKNFCSKGDFINNYMKQNNIKDVAIIEDSSVNINSCACYNIQCYLVNWGYISPREKGLSVEQIIEKIEV